MFVEILHTSQGVNEEAFVGKDAQAAGGDRGDPGGRIWVNTLSSSNLKRENENHAFRMSIFFSCNKKI